MTEEEVEKWDQDDVGAGSLQATVARTAVDIANLESPTFDELLQKLQTLVHLKIGDMCPHIHINLEKRRIDLTQVRFKAGTAVIKQEDMHIVEELRHAVRVIHETVVSANLPELHLRVEGHVFKTKNVEKGWALSQERANVISAQVVSGGTPKHILHPKGYGASRPIGTPRENRRVELHVMTQEEVAAWLSEESEPLKGGPSAEGVLKSTDGPKESTPVRPIAPTQGDVEEPSPVPDQAEQEAGEGEAERPQSRTAWD
jgi:outer membrane protein OmpA-like peptidoglycan-associated protein